VIGVGEYPHLGGGKGKLTPAHDGMGQLTAPPLSAREVATWLIANLYDPDKPLASVALLLSEAQPRPFRNPTTGEEFAVAPATIDNTQTAIREWFDRADTDTANRVLFFFSGHGTARGPDVALLLADYGATRGNALDGAIDFTGLHSGMSLCAARQQIYFVDACRSNSDTIIGANRGRPIYVASAWDPKPAGLREAPVFYSTISGSPAYGTPNKPSPFADALLRSFKGGAADDIHAPNDWRVDTTKLQAALNFYMDRAIGPGGQRAQIPASNDLSTIELHRVRGKPKATAVVGCVPNQANSFAALACWSGRTLRDERPPSQEEWVVDLPVGNYDFVATFPGGPYVRRRVKRELRPTWRQVELKVLR